MDLCAWAKEKDYKLILKLHPRMNSSDITFLADSGIIIDDTDQPGEVYHSAKLCLSITSQVIWFGNNAKRVSLINLLNFSSTDVRDNTKTYFEQ